MDHLELTETPGPNRPADPEGDPLPAHLPPVRGAGVSHLSRQAGTCPGRASASAWPPRSASWGAVHPGRALHRPAPAGQRHALDTLKNLQDLGNTFIVVEHDEDTMRAADYIVDIGPGAGVHGGEVIAAGTPEEIMAVPVPHRPVPPAPKDPGPPRRRPGQRQPPSRSGAAENNLTTSTSPFPWGPSPASLACPVPGSPPW